MDSYWLQSRLSRFGFLRTQERRQLGLRSHWVPWALLIESFCMPATVKPLARWLHGSLLYGFRVPPLVGAKPCFDPRSIWFSAQLHRFPAWLRGHNCRRQIGQGVGW